MQRILVSISKYDGIKRESSDLKLLGFKKSGAVPATVSLDQVIFGSSDFRDVIFFRKSLPNGGKAK